MVSSRWFPFHCAALLAGLPAAAPAQVTWTRAAVLSGRVGAAMAYDSARDRLVLFGGQPVAGQTAGDTWESGGRGWTLRTPAVSPVGRSNHAMAYDPLRSRVVLFGGRSFVNGIRIMGDTWEWDGITWTERFPAHRPPSRDDLAMAWDSAGGRIVLFGGNADQGGGFHLYSADMWAWDGTDWTQLQPATRPVARKRHALAWDPARQRLVLFGGELLNGGSQPAGDTWEWDGATWLQRFPTASPVGRKSHTMIYRATSGRVVVFGGNGVLPGYRNDMWEWDGTTWSQLATTTPPAVREHHCMAWDSVRSAAVIFGGWDDSLRILGDTWRLDSAAVWTTSAHGTPPMRQFGAMAADTAQRRLVLFGGYVLPSQPMGDTWESDGAAWVQRAPATSPTPRAGHAMATDPVTGRALLFGGGWGASHGLSDTWEWNGSTWTPLPTTVSPPGRYLHAMCARERDGTVLLFGGQAASGELGDTWQLDASARTWTQRFPAHQPPGRGRHGMAYDVRRDRVVLFGGFGPRGDTWEWDGTDWSQRLPAVSPPARSFPGVTYDPERARVVLFGGFGWTKPGFNDTWEWDGSNWTPRAPLLAPPPSSTPLLAFDPERLRAVVVTGTETWEYGPVHPASLLSFGPGCAGSLGTPALMAHDGSLPWLQDRFDLEIRQVPASQSALVLLGASRSSWLGAVQLPLDLGPAGMPGCHLRVAMDFVDLATPAGTVANWSLVLPADLTLRGRPLFLQSLVTDPGANPMGAALSNACEGRIGSR